MFEQYDEVPELAPKFIEQNFAHTIKINLASVYVTEEYLYDIIVNTKASKIVLSGLKAVTTNEYLTFILKHIRKNTNITEISFDHDSPLICDTCKIICDFIGRNRTISVLSILPIPIDAVNIYDALKINKTIRSLKLLITTDTDVGYFRNIIQLRTIHELHLKITEGNKNAVAIFSALIKATHIKSLYINARSVTDHIYAIISNPNLQHISITGMYDVGGAQSKIICKAIAKNSSITSVHIEYLYPIDLAILLESDHILKLNVKFMNWVNKNILDIIDYNYTLQEFSYNNGASVFRNEIAEITRRNKSITKQSTNQLLIDLSLIFSTYTDAIYVILEIVEWLPYQHLSKMSLRDKAQTLTRIFVSIREIKQLN